MVHIVIGIQCYRNYMYMHIGVTTVLYFSVTKYQKMLKKRLDNIENYEIPKEEFSFPPIPDGSIAAYTFSLSDGVRWRVSLKGVAYLWII